MRRGILPNPCHGTRHWLPSEREGGKRFRRTDSFPGGGALCLRLDPGRFWTESIYGSAWFKNAQGCMTREGYPKTVSEHRQAAVVRAAGHPTQEKAKNQIAEPDARLHRSQHPPPLLPMHPLIQPFSLLRHCPPCQPNMPTLPRTFPSTDAT
jgi:hypothetical protein